MTPIILDGTTPTIFMVRDAGDWLIQAGKILKRLSRTPLSPAGQAGVLDDVRAMVTRAVSNLPSNLPKEGDTV